MNPPTQGPVYTYDPQKQPKVFDPFILFLANSFQTAMIGPIVKQIEAVHRIKLEAPPIITPNYYLCQQIEDLLLKKPINKNALPFELNLFEQTKKHMEEAGHQWAAEDMEYMQKYKRWPSSQPLPDIVLSEGKPDESIS